MKILLLDNYDSFTYNLFHYIEGLDVDVEVVFNNEIELDEVEEYDKIVFSPGPGLPDDAGMMKSIIDRYHLEKPIFGVCLGFQGLVEYFGGSLFNQEIVKHGVAEFAEFDIQSKLFRNTDTKFKVGLYHSWAANRKDFPEQFSITATSENSVIMAFEHKVLPIAGVQFHPESILSEHGRKIVENFIFNFE